MKKINYCILSLLIISSPMVSAQQWSKEEQEVLSQIKTCWDAWMEGIHKNDPKIWFQKCPIAPNTTMWWTNEGTPTPVNYSYYVKNWELMIAVVLDWIDIRPVKINIIDEVAIVHFYGMWKAKTNNGPVVTEYKRTEIFKKMNGSWTFIGGQGTPVSNKDADPNK